MMRMRSMAVLPPAIGLLAGAALAQEAGQNAKPRKPPAPLVINDDTIGILRQRQVGSLILPQGTPPFPAVVVLHGCNGVSSNTRVWARRLATWGYAALIIDSFSSRRLAQVCDGSRALPGTERAQDAFAAARYLRSRPDIDGQRIGVLGYSHGGWSALAAATEASVKRAQTPPFRAVVSFYPYCPKIAPPLATDLQIFIGDADDWALAARCTAFVAKYAEGAPHRPALVVYPGAKHSFESKRPDRVYFGHALGYDAKATADALERTRKFLDAHLRP